MINGASVGAWTHDSISVRSELLLVRFESIPSFFCTSFENDYHETTHKEGSIGLLSIVKRGVMIYLIFAILFIADQLL